MSHFKLRAQGKRKFSQQEGSYISHGVGLWKEPLAAQRSSSTAGEFYMDEGRARLCDLPTLFIFLGTIG